jgi:hypothetical protein
MRPPELTHPHDLLVRRFLTDPALMADLLRYYPQKPADQQTVNLIDLKHLECKSPVTIDEQLTEGIGDLRFSTSFKGKNRKSNVFLLFKHQSKVEPDFRLRGLKYIVGSYEEFRKTTKEQKKLPYPIVVVLYHGEIAWKHLPEMDELIDIVPGVKTGLLDYQLILIDVSTLSAGQFQGHPVLQAVLESLQLASERRLAREFDRVIDRLVAVKNDPRIKTWLEPLTRYAMSVAKIGTEQISKALSKVLSEREANKMAMSTGERLYLDGEKKGIAIGEARGNANMVLTALRTKFKKVPKDIERSVLAMSDSIALESLLVQAIHSNTLDEFAEALR